MKEVRLKKRSEFMALSKSRQSVFMPHFIVQYLFKEAQGFPRFGYTVSKKVGNAVARNRVKRRLRELVRLTLKKNHDFFTLSYDIVFIARSSARQAPFDELIKHFEDALMRITSFHT